MDQYRKDRLKKLIELRFNGSRPAFIAAAGITKGRASQLLSPDSPFGERAAQALAEKLGLRSRWFEADYYEDFLSVGGNKAHSGTVVVPRAQLKLSADSDEVVVQTDDSDSFYVSLSRKWVEYRNYQVEDLLALEVTDASMVPAIHLDDVVVINRRAVEPTEGEVFAVNYEGKLIFRRTIRDEGEWWLQADGDQRTFPRKRLSPPVSRLIGAVVHLSTEKI